MKVAVVKTGPGVTCPTATASSSCASVSQCPCSTRSARSRRQWPPEAAASVEVVPLNTPGQLATSLGTPPVVMERAQHRICASCPGGAQGSPVYGLTPLSAEHSGGAAGYWYGLRARSL